MLLRRGLNACALTWLGSGLMVASCGGNAFTGSGTSGGAASAVEAGASSGGVISGAGGTASAGAPEAGPNHDPSAGASNPPDGAAGTTAGSDAGASGMPECAGVAGKVFNGHCYIDVTVRSVVQAHAVIACEAVSASTNVPAHLLVLESLEEQKFILETFLRAFEDKSDAWLGLTCDSFSHPEISDCYCTDCKAELPTKQKAWKWIGGASSTFGWVNGNPNGAYRCSALAWNSESMLWGWVDRACDKASAEPIAGHPHDYRTICELEP